MLAVGPLEIRWYGLFFAIGILLNYLILKWIFKREKASELDLDSLVIYLFFGLVIGARLGHIIFYNWEYFSSNPIEILKIWNGGLASHGAAVGLLIAYSLWVWIHKANFAKYADMLVIPMPLTAAFVRLGNFFNSEIVGTPTGANGEVGDFGIVFKRLGEDFPRHPAQLYEGAASLAIFFVLMLVYKKWFGKLPKLFMTFLYVGLYFVARFGVEYFKDQAFLADTWLGISRGQWLSVIPIGLAAGYFVWRAWKKDA